MSRHRKILTSSRLVHSIDSALDPDNFDEITYLNKDGCWETKSNKATEKIFGQVTFLHVLGGKDNVTLFQAVKTQFYLGEQNA